MKTPAKCSACLLILVIIEMKMTLFSMWGNCLMKFTMTSIWSSSSKFKYWKKKKDPFQGPIMTTRGHGPLNRPIKESPKVMEANVTIIGKVILIGVFGNDVLLPTHHTFFCHFHEKKFKNELLMSYHHENHVLPADDFFNIKESWPKKVKWKFLEMTELSDKVVTSPNKPKNFFFHEMFDVASMHGCCWPAFAYLDWPKWGTKLSFSEWVSKSTTFTTSCPTSLWLSLKNCIFGRFAFV